MPTPGLREEEGKRVMNENEGRVRGGIQTENKTTGDYLHTYTGDLHTFVGKAWQHRPCPETFGIRSISQRKAVRQKHRKGPVYLWGSPLPTCIPSHRKLLPWSSHDSSLPALKYQVSSSSSFYHHNLPDLRSGHSST